MSSPHRRYVPVLRNLLRAWRPEDFIVCGAMALAAQSSFRWRGTADLDLAVAATLGRVELDLKALGWRRGQGPVSWITAEDELVDVIPAHPSLLEKGGLSLPDGNTQINLLGFALAFRDAVRMELAEDVSVRVASLRALVLLKMGAYLDRPWQRDNDLADVAHIMFEFLGPQSDDRWSDEIVQLELDYEDVGPFVLGSQLGALVDSRERGLVERFLDDIENPESPLATLSRMARGAPPEWRNPDTLRARVRAFHRGFKASASR